MDKDCDLAMPPSNVVFSGGEERLAKEKRPTKTAPNKPHAGSPAKTNIILEFFGGFGPNAVRSKFAVVRPSSPSFGGSCGLPIRPRVTSARLMPVLGRGSGRKHFRQTANTTVAHKLIRRLPHFRGAAAVVCNAASERQKTRPTQRHGGRPGRRFKCLS